MSDRDVDFEKAALRLMALNMAFDSARCGEFREEILEWCEETGERATPGAGPGSSDSV